MLSELDHGVRCDDHVGEAFRVRCVECDREAAEARLQDARIRYEPGSNCSRHDGYPLPCDRCRRERTLLGEF